MERAAGCSWLCQSEKALEGYDAVSYRRIVDRSRNGHTVGRIEIRPRSVAAKFYFAKEEDPRIAL
jgi:hypothetical protein